MGNEKCENCRFWNHRPGIDPFDTPDTPQEEGQPSDNWGVCRRFPPVFSPDPAEEGFAYQPLTEYDEWCGEWKHC